MKRQRENMQTKEIRNEKEDIRTNMEEIQRIIRSCFKNLYFTKLENLKEIGNFLNKYHLPKLNQDQISKFHRPITAEEIETVIKSLPTKNAQDQMVSAHNSTRL